jgi:hypothetical protein
MMRASDYPYCDPTFPQSREAIARNVANVPEDEQALILGGNREGREMPQGTMVQHIMSRRRSNALISSLCCGLTIGQSVMMSFKKGKRH